MKQSNVIKKYEKWRKGLENNDSKIKPYYIISYQYPTSGNVAVLMNFNLSLKKAQEYLQQYRRRRLPCSYRNGGRRPGSS
jgi:hypothetical protein